MSAAGAWKVSFNSPQGSQEATATFTVEGSILTRSISAPGGAVEIEDGAVDGDQLRWTTKMDQPMPLTMEYTADVDGDSISGSVKAGTFGEFPFEGSRA
ncbi:MAG: hypothetical protein V7636_2740 [Actinomycetota bacterium]